MALNRTQKNIFVFNLYLLLFSFCLIDAAQYLFTGSFSTIPDTHTQNLQPEVKRTSPCHSTTTLKHLDSKPLVGVSAPSRRETFTASLETSHLFLFNVILCDSLGWPPCDLCYTPCCETQLLQQPFINTLTQSNSSDCFKVLKVKLLIFLVELWSLKTRTQILIVYSV